MAILLLPATVASAASCDGDCLGPDCYGGCSINSRDCSVGCFDGNCNGTKAQCFEYGSDECDQRLTATCAKIISEVPPGEVEPNGTANFEVRNTEWSVVSYQARGPVPADLVGFEVLAASSRAEATNHVAELRGLRQDLVRSPAALRLGVTVDRGPALQRRLAHHVAPGTHCVRATLEMSTPRFDLSIPQGASVFVRATVDAGGNVAAAELLHADRTQGAEAAMVDFLKEFGHLTRADGEQSPFEAFIVLSSKSGGQPSWIVAGSKLLF